MAEINPRVNLYLFIPHPSWGGVGGAAAVVARDFQRAEAIARKEAGKLGVPGRAFSILIEELSADDAVGFWVEAERYRDVEDDERLVFFQFGVQRDLTED